MDPNSKQCKQLRRSGHGLSNGVPSALRTCISAKSPTTCAVAARRDVRAGGLAGGLWVDGALWVHGHCGGIIPSAICPTRNRRGTSTSQRYGPGEAERGRRVAFARPGRCISKRSDETNQPAAREQGHPKGRLRDWCSYDCHRGPTWLGFGRLGGPLGPCWVPMERSGQPDRGGRQRWTAVARPGLACLPIVAASSAHHAHHVAVYWRSACLLVQREMVAAAGSDGGPPSPRAWLAPLEHDPRRASKRSRHSGRVDGAEMERRWIEDDGVDSPKPRATRVQRKTEGSILAAAKPIKLLLCHPDRQWAPA